MVNKVLFVVYKHNNGNPNESHSICNHVIVDSAIQSRLINQWKCFYFDEVANQHGTNKMSLLLLEECRTYKPDLVFFTFLFDSINPSMMVFHRIQNDLKIKCCFIYFDYIHGYKYRHVYENITKWLSLIEYGLVIDTASVKDLYDDYKVIQGYTSVDSSVFFDKSIDKDIDVSFLGSVSPDLLERNSFLENQGHLDFMKESYSTRDEYLSYLIENLKGSGINLFIGTGIFSDKRLTTQEYADIISRSKISINFSQTMGGYRQIKGRVFEILASNTLLLEEEGPDTKRFFDSGKEFVIFENKEDLLKKILYYLSNATERRFIANNGYEKVSNVYNNKNMWTYTFFKLGFSAPDQLETDTHLRKHKELLEAIQNHPNEYRRLFKNKPIRNEQKLFSLLRPLPISISLSILSLRGYIKSKYYKIRKSINNYTYVNKIKKLALNGVQKVVIFGASLSGGEYFKYLESQGIEVAFFVDNSSLKHGKRFMGRMVYPIEYLIETGKNEIDLIILASFGNKEDMLHQLGELQLAEYALV